MDVIWKGLLGGLVTALIVLASKKGNVLPGILPLAPTFSIFALLAVGSKGDPGGLRETCLASARTIPAYFAFLGGCWLLIGRVDYRLVIAGGVCAWLIAALAIFLMPRAFPGA